METLEAQLEKMAPLSEGPPWAGRVPLVHFPAGNTFVGDAERPGVSAWASVSSRSVRGQQRVGGSLNAKLTAQCVFFFAGSAGFASPDAEGDCALYFRPAVEADGIGSATPFDSGALLAPRDFLLEPWRGAGSDLPAREADFLSLTVELATWRAVFAAWLARCFDDPIRYLACEPDRRTTGRPNVTVPPELLSSDADRRAWTWEVRIEGQVGFEHLGVLHVPQALLRRANEWKEARGLAVRIRTYETADDVASPDALFAASGDITRTEFLAE